MKNGDKPVVDYAAKLREVREYLQKVPDDVKEFALGFKDLVIKTEGGYTNYKYITKVSREISLGGGYAMVKYKITMSCENHSVYHNDVEVTKKLIVVGEDRFFGKFTDEIWEERKII